MKEKIIKMAREAGGHFVELPNGDAWVFGDEHIERFFHMAQAAEREACAKDIENYALGYSEPTWAFKLTSIIRARGQA